MGHMQQADMAAVLSQCGWSYEKASMGNLAWSIAIT